MHVPDTAANGRTAALPWGVGTRSEPDELRSLCRAQALKIDALAQAVATLRRGAAALNLENAELRAERGGARTSERRLDGGRALAVRLPCDARAPGAARIVVTEHLRGRVTARGLDSARLLVSELVANSVRHSGAGPEDLVIVRVGLSPAHVALEVEDAGRGGVIAPRAPDRDDGGGFGLQLVQTLSERWGHQRLAAG